MNIFIRELEIECLKLKKLIEEYQVGHTYLIDCIATSLRLLCHDKHDSESLLKLADAESIIIHGKNIKSNSHCSTSLFTYYSLSGIEIFLENEANPIIRTGKIKLNKNSVFSFNDGNFYQDFVEFGADIPNMKYNIELLDIKNKGRRITSFSKAFARWYYVKTNSPSQRQSLISWWNEPVLKKIKKQWTRREVILYFANKSGGAHVSKDLDKSELYFIEREDVSRLKNIHFLNSGLEHTVYVSAVQILEAIDLFLASKNKVPEM